MRRLHLLFAFIFFGLLISRESISQVISYADSWEKQGLTLQKQTKGGVEVNYSITEFYFEDLTVNDEQLLSVKLPGVFLPNDEGSPDLPGVGKYVAIPQGSEATLKIIAARTETISDVEIAPAPHIPLDTDKGPLFYEKNMKIYSRDEFYPKNPVIISEKTNIRGVDVVMLGITPFQYNPVSKELIVYRDIQVEVTFTGGNGHFGDDRLRSRWWDPILQETVLNYKSLPEVDYNKPHNIKSKSPDYEYLIIIPDIASYHSWADSIKLFRNLQGINTGIVTTTEIGGNTVSAIESYVDNAYNTWDVPPSAVLLLADYSTGSDGITSQTYTHPAGYPDFVSDNRFSDVTGNDLPDIAFARITANDASQLEVMITKFLDYERNPPSDAGFYDHPITALGWQTERWFQICSEVVGGYLKNVKGKNPVRINAVYGGDPTTDPWSTATNTSTVVNYFGPSGLDYIPATPQELGGFSGGTATDVVNAINNGSFMLQHRDHGSYTGWGEPAFNTSSINSLTNVNNKLPYIFSINCETGAFHRSSECFAEKFHRYTYGGQNSGALGILAATEVSYSFVNDTYMWGVMDNLFPDFMPAENTAFPVNYVMPAFGNAAGKHFLYQSSWPYNSGDKQITYRLFHHHGGAFLTLYTEVPQNLTVVHDPVLIAGATTFSVTADAGSLIALTVNGEIIGTADGTGSAVAITIPAQSPGNVMVVTITKQNYYRYSASVNIVADGIYAEFSADDTSPCTGSPVNFTDLSFGTISSWSWSFPGGTPSSYNGQNPPPVTYSSAGTYDVSLVISDGSDTDTETKTGYITVTDVVADFSGTPTTVIVGNTVTFTDNSGCNPTSWSWSFPGGTPGSATGQGPHTIAYNTVGTYDVSLQVTNGYGYNTETKTGYIEVINCNYCSSAGSTYDEEWISNVTFNTINNTSDHPAGYNDYTSISTDVLPGSSYSVSVTCSSTGTWTENYFVFIDWNHDCDFDDTGESYDLGQTSGPGTKTLSITVPVNAANGTTRIRVSLKYGSDPGPCESFSYGEVEDYSLKIVRPGLWKGAVSTDWSVASNWDDGNIPVAGTDVTIPAYPAGGIYPETNTGSGAECANLTIESGAHLFIPPGKSLSVNGTLTNNAGPDGLVLEANSSGVASLINSTTDIPAKVQQHLSADAWHLVSAPVAGAQSGVYTGIYLYDWSESDSVFTPITSTSFDLSVTHGYYAYSQSSISSPTDVEFSGTLNTGDKPVTWMTYTPQSYSGQDGWNLAGNPYPSGLKWDNTWSQSNLTPTVYVFDAAGAGNWLHFNYSNSIGNTLPNGEIPPAQGFFVWATSSPASMTIPNSARVHTSNVFYKNSEVNEDVFSLKITGETNNYFDLLTFGINKEATDDFDYQLDAYKIMGFNDAPQLYSYNQKAKLSVDQFPEFTGSKSIPLGIKVGISSEYSFNIQDLELFNSDIAVYLEDKVSGVFIDLRENPVYTFYAEAGLSDSRFVLHFNPDLMDVNPSVLNRDVDIYSFSNKVFINYQPEISGIVTIYDVSGKMVAKGNVIYGLNELNLNSNSGYFIVKVVSQESVITKKVFIK